MTTGERIKTARKQAGMTQMELAEKLNIPYQSIGQWERNLRKPKQTTLQRLAGALDCDVLWLMWGETPDHVSEDIMRLFHTEEPAVEKAAKLAVHYTNTAHTARGYTFSPQEGELIGAFALLNARGQQVALERLLELTKISDYRKNNTNSD